MFYKKPLKTKKIEIITEKETETFCFQNGRRFFVKNRTKKKANMICENNKITYDVENLVDDKKPLIETLTPVIKHESEIMPEFIMKSRSLNRIVTIEYELCSKHFHKNDKAQILEDATIITKIQLIVFVLVCGKATRIERRIIENQILSKTEIKHKIEESTKPFFETVNLFENRQLLSIDPQNYDIILPAGRGGIFIHEAIGHAMEGDLLEVDSNVFTKFLGKRITSNNITISDCCDSKSIVQYAVSDDGTPPKTVMLVQNGFFSGVMSNYETSHKLGYDDTGNGRSADGYDCPLVRMRNTYLHNGTINPNDIIESTKNGIIASEIGGGNVNLAKGTFVFNVILGMVVKEGKIEGPSKPFLLSGSIMNALDSIECIGNDLSFSSAICYKKGQPADVSYGQPTIRLSRRKKWI